MTAKEPESHGESKSQNAQSGGDESPIGTDGRQGSQAEAHASHMQASFEKTVCTELELPFRYRSVAVLIIRWAEYLDRDLLCGTEVRNWNELFTNAFKFRSKILTLDDKRNPQLQLNRGIAELADDHNGSCRTHLLIVYYTGHGSHDDEGGLTITGVRGDNDSAIGPKYKAEASWNKAEQSLHEADADVLTILDTCSAGSVMKGVGDNEQTFEVLAAAGRKKPTAAPGSRSFTRALIDALQEQLNNSQDAPFTTYDLNQEIMRRRKNHGSHVFPRRGRHRGRFIKLAPLDSKDKMKTPVLSKNSSYLTLRFGFNNSRKLTPPQAERLAKELSQGASRSELNIRSIDWVEYSPSKNEERTADEVGERIADMARLLKSVVEVQRRWRGQPHKSSLKRKNSSSFGEDRADVKRPRTPNGFHMLSPSPSI